MTTPVKMYRLLAADGSTYESATPGQLGGNRDDCLYGRLDCPSAIRHLQHGYAKIRVFFADEAAAIAAKYRPCAKCLPSLYKTWKAGGAPGTPEYPWLVIPPVTKS